MGGLADSVSSRLVGQANIRAGPKRRYLLFGTILTFQVARMAVLREIHVPAHWCCFACSPYGWCIGCCCFLPCLLLRGVAWPPLGGVLGGATFPLSSVGRCCLASSLRCCCVFPLLYVCWGVRWFGGSVVRCCVLGRVLGGWVVGVGVGVWLLSVGWSRGRVAFGVFSVWIGVGVASIFSRLGSNNDENDTDHL